MSHKILIVEDDAPMALLLKKILAKKYDVTSVGNGLDAIRWLSAGNLPHLILTDLNMPIIDGEELITNLKKSGLYRRIPVIILTAHNEKSIQEKLKNLGCTDYLLKPFEPDTLKHKVHQVLGSL